MAVHGTTGAYKNGCRCEGCREANRIYQADYRAGHRRPREPARGVIRRADQPDRPTCVDCGRRIVGIPDGWKHTADNRQYGDDGHEATPRTIAA